MSSADLVTPWSGFGTMNGCATDWWKNGSGCKRAADCASAAPTAWKNVTVLSKEYSYLDEIERITSKTYTPTDGTFFDVVLYFISDSVSQRTF
jgi:hypothetical protein